jgi:oligoendopeptidase F
LASGGSDHPEKLLAPLGIDLTSETFWQKGFDIVKGYIDRLESLSV